MIHGGKGGRKEPIPKNPEAEKGKMYFAMKNNRITVLFPYFSILVKGDGMAVVEKPESLVFATS